MATLLANTSRVGAAQPRPGDVVADRYQIEEAIGHGGYGQVFRARHLGTGQDVAIKVLLPQGGDESFGIKRFFLEARVTSGLKHANTIKVFDFGQEDSGLVFLAMELLAGRTLREELRERKKEGRPFTEREAAELGIAITRSLGEAHAAGLVHRDLKPDNVFLHRADEDDDATIKVLDFGIVKLGDGHPTLSSTTSVPGTPAYMSPEHALNQDVDGRSDLYSLGVILYQLVTLDLPFRGASDPQTLYLHAYQPMPDLLANAKTPVSQAFAVVVARVLSKRPDDRFADARAMRDALKSCSGGRTSAPASGPSLTAQSLDLPMQTPHADSHLMPTLTRPAHKWERWATIAGLAALLFSGGAVLVAIRGKPEPVVEMIALDAGTVLPDAPVAPDAGPADLPDAGEATPPKKKPRIKALKKERKKDLLHMRLEDMVDPK